jgi:CHAT domain-containing protein/tetratricopeptide (TPR) repeat protein
LVAVSLISCNNHVAPGSNNSQIISEPDSLALYEKAEASFQHGDLFVAQEKSEAGYTKFLASNPRLAGKFRLLHAQAIMSRGMFEEAEAELNSSPMALFPDCAARSRRLLLEAYSLASLGQGGAVNGTLRKAEKECLDPDPALAADIASMRGMVLDDAEVAEEDHVSSLTLARQQNDAFREAKALINLCNISQQMEHYDQSIDWGLAALRISKTMGYRRYEEKTEGNLAWNYYKLGNADRSLELFRDARQVAHELGASPDELRWENNLGLVHEQIGQLTLAKADYEQALKMAEQQQDENQTTIALNELAFLAVRNGEWEQAAQYSQRALEAAHKDEDRPLELQALFAQGLIASHQGDPKTATKLLLEVANDPNHDRQSLRWEAQSALAGLYAKEQNLTAANAEYRTALDTASQARCTIHKEDLRLPFFANTARLYDSYIDFLVHQGKTAEALKTADQSRALTLAEGLGVEGKKCLASEAAFEPERIARQLQATILFYWLGAEHSYLWVVTPDRTKVFPLPASAEIAPLIQAYRKSLLGSRDPLQAGDKSGQQLYQTLVAPAAELLPHNGRVVLITDGSLSGLSFDSLIAPQPQPHYWIDDVTLENAASLRLLAARSTKRGGGKAKLLLMGNAIASGDPDFPPLRRAWDEMESVRGYFPTVQEVVYTGDHATVAAYFGSHPEEFSYIHFVAHGTASVSDPLDSAVVLSPASQGGNYKLYARDVIAHPLKADLVTISACKGAGTGFIGEGLVGLSWAFLHAGAHNVIGALWEVSDESTPQLMDVMYAELSKGSSPDAALRAAKLSLLHSGGVFRKPIYWAAFQVYTGS